MEKTKIIADLQPLEDFLKTLGGDFVARVGVLGGKNAREDGDGLGNADIGLIHELGSEWNNIPARSFLKMPLEEKSDVLLKALTAGLSRKAFEDGDIKGLYEIMGLAAEGVVLQAFRSGGYGKWEPNQPATVRKKGSSAPLIDSRQLGRAVTSDVVKKGSL